MPVFERTTLSNGIRAAHGADAAGQVGLLLRHVRARAHATKSAEESGIAHFAEHMFFKGTERRPTARDIATEIDGIGGEFNAFTGKEYTGYYVKCAAETRDVALDVLVDMLRNSRFDPEEIDREKGVIVEEMNMYFDTPRDFIGGVYENLLYGDQPLGRDIIGTKETVRAATRDTFTSFIDRWYRPERTVVGLGGLIGDGLVDRLEELLGSIEPRPTGCTRARRDSGERLARSACTRSSRTRRTSCSARAATRSATPTGTSCSSPRRCSAAGCPRGSSPRCASAEVSPTTSSARTTSYTDAGSLYAQAGVDINRIDDAVTTIAAELRRIAERAGARRRAREGSRVRQGPLRARPREPARHDHVRAAARGPAGRRRGARRRARRASTPSRPRTSSASRRMCSGSSCDSR